MTVREAQRAQVCRICGADITVLCKPYLWMDHYAAQIFPEYLTLDYGKEFAHTACVEARANYAAVRSLSTTP